MDALVRLNATAPNCYGNLAIYRAERFGQVHFPRPEPPLPRVASIRYLIEASNHFHLAVEHGAMMTHIAAHSPQKWLSSFSSEATSNIAHTQRRLGLLFCLGGGGGVQRYLGLCASNFVDRHTGITSPTCGREAGAVPSINIPGRVRPSSCTRK